MQTSPASGRGGTLQHARSGLACLPWPPLPAPRLPPPHKHPICCSGHSGPVWSLSALPDSSGFVSGSADHDIKFWEWGVAADPDTGAKQLGINHTRCARWLLRWVAAGHRRAASRGPRPARMSIR